MDDYRKFHFVPTDIVVPDNVVMRQDIQAVSRTLEYVYDDFCVLTLARKFGSAADVADLESRLRWYAGLWDKDGGFMRGRRADGSWHVPFDPLHSETGPQYYEGHAWTWSWYVPHDPQGLIDLLGGNAAFVDKLTVACDKYYQALNEPCMLETYLFIHAGRADRTEYFARKTLENFNATARGLPGNDDSGTTSGWLVWDMLGIYPNAGQEYYYLGSPVFTKATIRLGNGQKIIIKAPASNDANKYVSSASLNGKPWNQSWLRHADLIDGAEIVFDLGPEPTRWGSQNPPPSLSTAPRTP